MLFAVFYFVVELINDIAAEVAERCCGCRTGKRAVDFDAEHRIICVLAGCCKVFLNPCVNRTLGKRRYRKARKRHYYCD